VRNIPLIEKGEKRGRFEGKVAQVLCATKEKGNESTYIYRKGVFSCMKR